MHRICLQSLLTDSIGNIIIHPKGECREVAKGWSAVHVTFRTSRLKKYYEESEQAKRRWGEAVGRQYIQRINVLYAAVSADDLYRIPALEFHPLKGDRKGQFALTIIGRVRLIVSFSDKNRTRVRVEEVSKHYGD